MHPNDCKDISGSLFTPGAPDDDRLSVSPSLDRFPDVLQPLLDRLARDAAS